MPTYLKDSPPLMPRREPCLPPGLIDLNKDPRYEDAMIKIQNKWVLGEAMAANEENLPPEVQQQESELTHAKRSERIALRGWESLHALSQTASRHSDQPIKYVKIGIKQDAALAEWSYYAAQETTDTLKAAHARENELRKQLAAKEAEYAAMQQQFREIARWLVVQQTSQS